MSQHSRCLDLLRSLPSKDASFFSWKKEAPHSFQVKHLQFHMKEVLFYVSLIKNNTPPTSSTHSFDEQ